MNEYKQIVEQYFSDDKKQAIRKLTNVIKNNESSDRVIEKLFKEIVLLKNKKVIPFFVKVENVDICLSILKDICSDAQIDLNFLHAKEKNIFSKIKNAFNLIIQFFWFSKNDYIFELLYRRQFLSRYFSISEKNQKIALLNSELKNELLLLHVFTVFKRIVISLWLFLMYMYTAPVVAAINYKIKLKSAVTDQYSSDINYLGELIAVASLSELDDQLKLNQSEIQQLPDELKKDLETP